MSNPRHQWCIVIGKPTKLWAEAPDWDVPDLSHVGEMMSDYDGQQLYPILYGTRQEARAMAKWLHQNNLWWNYHAKKYSP